MTESIHAELDPLRWQVDYFTSDSIHAGVSARIRRHAFGFFVRNFAREAFRRGQAYNIINIHEPSGAALMIGKSQIGSPAIIAMSHGVEQRYWELRLRKHLAGPSPPGLKERFTYPAFSLWQSRLTLCAAEHVFCLNREDQAFLVERFKLLHQDVTCVYPGVGEIFSRMARMREYPRQANKLLFSGTWIERKGIRQVVGALAELTKRNYLMELGILGAGVGEERVLSDFPANLRSRVRVFPPMNHVACSQLLLEYDLFILPSWYEGTPLALLEAMATGMPVITTATCGMKDVVVSGKNGLLISPGHTQELTTAVEHLFDNRELRLSLGLEASLAARRYTWPKTAEVVAEAYERVLGSSATHASLCE